MKKITYKVNGESTTEPTSLPDGLSVEKVVTDVPVEAVIISKYGIRFEMKENDCKEDFVLTASSGMSGDRLFAREDVIRFRDQLTTLLDDTQSLRKVKDSSGVDPIWIELDQDEFWNFDNVGDAKRAKDRGGNPWTLERIREIYGIVNVTKY